MVDTPAPLEAVPGGSKKAGFEFELHYGLLRKNAQDVLQEILVDLSTYKHIHNWDDKLVTSPLTALAGTTRSYLNENIAHLDSLLDDAVVDEVLTVDGINSRPSTKQETSTVDSYLFFTKHSPSKESPAESAPETTSTSAPTASRTPTPVFSQGRIVYIKEKITPARRASALILHSFCNRLQFEDYGFIRTFIERHLTLRCAQKVPYHWQQISPPEMNSSRQRCYKRVTLSCHIAYMSLDSHSTTDKKDIIDRNTVFTFQSSKGSNSNGLTLSQTSSSVLLTLVRPEESESREEETSLLRNPKALWTVLVINCPSNLASDHGPPEHLTPISQYIRGITSSLVTQRINAQTIYDAIKDELDRSEGDSLFDDEHFTKSTLYHSAVRACDGAAESISLSLRFLRKMLETQIRKLCCEAHAYEKLGIEYWMQRMEEEMFAVEDLESRFIALRAQVQENRHALHGVTAVLEARLALQQGERMKTLAYLATIYLPLTSAASLYSMSVLPSSATFASFFVVFAISLLLTILLGLNLPTLLARLFHLSKGWTAQARRSVKTPSISFRRPEWTKIDYIQGYVDILNPTIDLKPSLSFPGERWGDELAESLPFLFFWFMFRRLPVLVLHHFLANEVNFPFYQWFLFQYRHHPGMDIYYHWAFFIRDFFRAILLPAWVALGGAVLTYLVVQDFLGICITPIIRPALRLIFGALTICFVGCYAAGDFIWRKMRRRSKSSLATGNP